MDDSGPLKRFAFRARLPSQMCSEPLMAVEATGVEG